MRSPVLVPKPVDEKISNATTSAIDGALGNSMQNIKGLSKTVQKLKSKKIVRECMVLLKAIYQMASCIYLLATLAFAVFISCMAVKIFQSSVWPILKYIIDILGFIKGPVDLIFKALIAVFNLLRPMLNWARGAVESAIKAIIPGDIGNDIAGFIEIVFQLADKLPPILIETTKAIFDLTTSGKQVWSMLFAIVGFAGTYFCLMLIASFISPTFPFTADISWVGLPAIVAGVFIFILRTALNKRMQCCACQQYSGPFANEIKKAYSINNTDDSVFWAWALIVAMTIVGFFVWGMKTMYTFS
jgi:hypothetical protein